MEHESVPPRVVLVAYPVTHVGPVIDNERAAGIIHAPRLYLLGLSIGAATSDDIPDILASAGALVTVDKAFMSMLAIEIAVSASS
jgi:hypothetical protein